ncbi:hypothetical protein Q4511_01905 [Paracoccus sp. 1_MG-2023]|uniref:nickel/cobalt transporter n=1 Tax=unclassified Paracoccus (in: a-proteobacteria) TaxID=2688777 RepID=UPI001C0A60D5|nr:MULTISPECIES: hypothetical protein [unclassified Paracoccus (in: a-proteobacteria)]MBU2958674.1 hypothetical protein [Paracoccus sp. C2R09]MDO6667667.1 hypothetical protein [Paracoccus sp. 1_MG-2023]
MSAARAISLSGLLVGALLLILWVTGGLTGIEHWAVSVQRETQTLMAGALRGLRAGQPGAVWTLIGLCFGYGVAHAVGPGHGKMVIGSYGYGADVPMGRLALLSVASSLAQAGMAVLLVWGGISLLDLGRERLTDLTERHMADLSALLIAGVGLWLAWRGLRQLRNAGGHHHHHHHEGCGCGHSHGPSIDQAAHVHGLRDGLIVIAGIAARPCTGALFLLILTWRMDIFGIGVLGAFAMGLGTALVTLAVAMLSVWARRGSAAALADGPAARWLPGVAQLAAGLLVAALSLLLLI